MCSLSSTEADCRDVTNVGYALEEEAIRKVKAQLPMPGSSGRVWIDDWRPRYQPALGQLRDFISRYPSMFKVIPQGDYKYVVELVELVDSASSSKSTSTGTCVQNLEQEFTARNQCRYFLRGCCRYGQFCNFAHNLDLKDQTSRDIVNLNEFATTVERFIADLRIDPNAAQRLRQQSVEKQRYILQKNYALRGARNTSAMVMSLCQLNDDDMFSFKKPSPVTPWKEEQTHTPTDSFKGDRRIGASFSVQQSTSVCSKENPQSRSQYNDLHTRALAKSFHDPVLLQACHPSNGMLMEWLGNAAAASTAAKMIAVQSEDYLKAEEESQTSQVFGALLDSSAVQHPNMLFSEVQAKLVSVAGDGKAARSRGEERQAKVCEVATVYLHNVMIAASLHAALQRLRDDKVQSAKNENFRRAHVLKTIEDQICSFSELPLGDMVSVVLPGISAYVSAAESTREQAGQGGDTILATMLQGQIEILIGLSQIWHSFLLEAPVSNAAHIGVALADFDGSAYGPEYLHLTKGMRLEIANGCEEDEGWIYGKHVDSSHQGWFPLSFWKSSIFNSAGESEESSSEAAISARDETIHTTQVGSMQKLNVIAGTWVGQDGAEYVVTLSSPFQGWCTKRTSQATASFPLFLNDDCVQWGKNGSYMLSLADGSEAFDSVLWRPRDAARKTFLWQRRSASWSASSLEILV